MNGFIWKWIIEALITISRQIHSCEIKLNRLLEIQGHEQDKVLITQTKRLHSATKGLKEALGHWQPQQPPPPTKGAKTNEETV